MSKIKPYGMPVRFLLPITCAIFWLATFVATHLPSQHVPMIGIGDKTMHFACYFVIATLLLLSLAVFGTGLARRVTTVLLTMVIYGALDEASQHFVPGRTPAIADWLADSLGVIAAIVVLELALGIRRKLRRSDKA